MHPPNMESYSKSTSYSPSFTNSGDPLLKSPRPRVKLGVLLLEARLVSSSALAVSVQQAEKTGKPLGQVLVETSRITELDLENVLEAQLLVEAGALGRQDAASALRCAREKNLPLNKVTRWLSETDKSVSSNETLLIELILESGHSQSRAVEEARRIAQEREISVAGALLKMRSLPFHNLNMVVECLKLIVDKKLDKSLAIRALKTAKDSNCDLETAFEKCGIKARNTLSKIKIGDILLSARVVSEAELLSCLEASINDNRLLGELLIEAGIVSKELLDESLFLQKLCQIELLSRQHAARLIKRAQDQNKSIKYLTTELNIFRDDPATFNGAVDLLISAKLTEESSICSAVKHFCQYGMDPLHALVARNLVSIQVFRAAPVLAQQLANGDIEKEEAVRVLYQCEMAKCEIDEALETLSLNSKERQANRIEQSITAGVNKKHSLPDLFHSVEFLLLAAVMVLTTAAATLLNLHGSELVVAAGTICLLVVSIFLTFTVAKFRQKRLVACHQEMTQKKEEAHQEMQRLRKYKQI